MVDDKEFGESSDDTAFSYQGDILKLSGVVNFAAEAYLALKEGKKETEKLDVKAFTDVGKRITKMYVGFQRLESAHNKLQTQYDEAKSGLSVSQKEVNTKEKEITGLKKSLETITAELTTLKSTISLKEKECASLDTYARKINVELTKRADYVKDILINYFPCQESEFAGHTGEAYIEVVYKKFGERIKDADKKEKEILSKLSRDILSDADVKPSKRK